MSEKRAEDFIISRKRKLYKFAKFSESDNCFDMEKWKNFSSDFAKITNNRELVIEIGAGSAIFLTDLAEKYPEKIFVALDKKSDRLWQGARIANEKSLKNIFYVWIDVARINQIFAKKSVDEIWLTFSDPFAHDDYQEARAQLARFYKDNLRFSEDENYEENLAKYKKMVSDFDNESRKNFIKYLRKNGRGRLSDKRFLDDYSEILNEKGVLNFKTDNAPLFEWSLKSFLENNWKMTDVSRNLHNESEDKFIDAQIMTSYEERFAKELLPISFAKFLI